MDEQQQQQQMEEFSVFACAKSLPAKEADRDMTYQKGFADLYKKYHALHGGYVLGNVPVQPAQTAQAGKAAMAAESGNAEYIDFRYASPLLWDSATGMRGVLYPVVRNGQVADLAMGVVTQDNTGVGFFFTEKNGFISAYIAEYQKKMFGAPSSAKYTTMSGETEIGEVVITLPQPHPSVPSPISTCIFFGE